MASNVPAGTCKLCKENELLQKQKTSKSSNIHVKFCIKCESNICKAHTYCICLKCYKYFENDS
jgi:hypothetical protein